MVSVQPNHAPFGMSNSYQPMASPIAFGGVGGIGNPGSIVSSGSAVPISNMQTDGNNNSNRVIPYHRVVAVQSEEQVKMIEDLHAGSMVFITGTSRRKRDRQATTDAPSRLMMLQSGPDAFSILASLKHASSILGTHSEYSLRFDNANATNGAPPDYIEKGGYVDDNGKPGTRVATDLEYPADNVCIFQPGSQVAIGNCFLVPLDKYLVHADSLPHSSSRLSAVAAAVGNKDWLTKLPTPVAKYVLHQLHKRMEDGNGPFTKWTPDGFIMYKYSTSDEKLSVNNAGSWDYQLDQKQGAVYNIAVSGPALCIDWTHQGDASSDVKMAKRCACLPRNILYLLVVATIDVGTPRSERIVENSMRYLRTTSNDLNQHANGDDWMGLSANEVIIGGWSVGSVIDSAAAPMSNSGNRISRPDISDGLMGIRVAIKIRFVDSFELHTRYWRKDRPFGVSRYEAFPASKHAAQAAHSSPTS